MVALSLVCLYLFLQMCFIWVLYRLSGNPSIVDVSWSLGLMIAGLIYLFSVPFTSRIAIITACLCIWALRLAIYLWATRIRHGHLDKRYLEISRDWRMNPALGFFINFQFQAVLILMLSSVFWFAANVSSPRLLMTDMVGVGLVVLGVLGESIADRQLSVFKRTNKGNVCNVGLWFYSRHPNYFFDWVSWVGFMFFGLAHPLGCIGVVSPMVLYIIFNYVTGPITERGSLESRGEAYRQYQQSTSQFFLWFKR